MQRVVKNFVRKNYNVLALQNHKVCKSFLVDRIKMNIEDEKIFGRYMTYDSVIRVL